MTSSLRKVVCMFRIKFPTKRIFRIFPILRIDGMALFGTYLWNDPRNNTHIILIATVKVNPWLAGSNLICPLHPFQTSPFLWDYHILLLNS